MTTQTKMRCYLIQTSKEALNNCKATNSEKDVFSTLQNFPISNEFALKCVKMRCKYKPAQRPSMIARHQFKERHSLTFPACF